MPDKAWTERGSAEMVSAASAARVRRMITSAHPSGARDHKQLDGPKGSEVRHA
jgi:hypothetical protein